jgi:uncharacterized membrane protein
MEQNAAPPPAAPPPPPPAAPAPDSNRTIMIVLAYLGILGLIPLLVEKNDKEVQWHAKNGLVLFAAWVVLWLLDFFVIWTLHIFGCLYSIFMFFVWILYLVLIVLGIAKALKGERLVVPVISQFADKF